MRNVLIQGGLLLSVAVISAFAAKPVGTLSSAGAVNINGTEMSASSVVFWPVANLDEISTLGSRAILILPDRSRITLDSHSKAKIVSDGSQTRVTVLGGSGRYDLVSPGSATVLVGSRVVSAAGGKGNFAENENGSGSRRHPDDSDGDGDKENKHMHHIHPSDDRGDR